MTQRTIAGYASIFGQPDLAGDEIIAGAFSQTLHGHARPLTMLYQHDATRPIGRWHSIEETRHGLWVEGVLAANVQLADEVFALARQGVLAGLSIGFRPVKATRGQGKVKRRLHEIDLVEVSLVTFPMQPLARLHSVAGPTKKDMP